MFIKNLLLSFLFFGSCLIAMSAAHASDSDWKLCKGETSLYGNNVKLVVNAYEHRTSAGRAADITLIYGGHVLKGSLNTSESTNGTIKLKGDNNSTFKGSAGLDYETSSLTLNGKLSLNSEVSPVEATLSCETL